jgi:hypothetical protein
VCQGDRIKCDRCEGTGKVLELVKAWCEICGRHRTIVDEIYGMCRECFSREAESEAEFCLTHGGDPCDGLGCQII